MTPFEIADLLRACLESAYADADDPETPAEICHRPGSEVPFSFGTSQDECCTGLGWVRVQTVEPVVDPSAGGDAAFNPCYGDRRVVIEIGVARCNPFGDSSRGPSCEVWTELALRMDLDRLRMAQAVCCLGAEAVGESTGVYRVLAGAWTPVDSSGSCAGGSMEISVFIDCADC